MLRFLACVALGFWSLLLLVRLVAVAFPLLAMFGFV